MSANNAAAGAAAHHNHLRLEEEELMTGYGHDDEGWEYKILRSHFGAFKTDDAVLQACAQESANGWELLEVFDRGRLRFRRRVEERSLDGRRHTGIPVYRTLYRGGGGGLAVALVIGLLAALVGPIVALLLAT